MAESDKSDSFHLSYIVKQPICHLIVDYRPSSKLTSWKRLTEMNCALQTHANSHRYMHIHNVTVKHVRLYA